MTATTTTNLIPVLLPTEDASQIYINGLTNKLFIKSDSWLSVSEPNRLYQHTYLCSHLPIKKNDYFYNATSKTVFKNDMGLDLSGNYPNESKVEFTTDPKLIADGVQKIDGNTKALVNQYENMEDGTCPECEFLNCICPERKVNFLEEFCNRYNQKDKIVYSNADDGMFNSNNMVDNSNQKDNQEGVDVEKSAEECGKKYSGLKLVQNSHARAFKDGYNQAIQSNAGCFSLEDINTAINNAVYLCEGHKSMGLPEIRKKVIQSITKESQLKRDIVIECEMGQIKTNEDGDEYGFPDMSKPKLKDRQPILTFK